VRAQFAVFFFERASSRLAAVVQNSPLRAGSPKAGLSKKVALAGQHLGRGCPPIVLRRARLPSDGSSRACFHLRDRARRPRPRHQFRRLSLAGVSARSHRRIPAAHHQSIMEEGPEEPMAARIQPVVSGPTGRPLRRPLRTPGCTALVTVDTPHRRRASSALIRGLRLHFSGLLSGPGEPSAASTR